MHLSERLIDLRLKSLHSVLRVPDDETMPAKPFHLSFRDFLLHEKTEFWVDEREMHQKLTSRCLSVRHRMKHFTITPTMVLTPTGTRSSLSVMAIGGSCQCALRIVSCS